MAAVPTGDRLGPYRGEDRRRVAGPVQSPFGRPWVMAVLLILATWAYLSFAMRISVDWADPAETVIQMLQVASFVVAIAVGGLAFSRWYLTSDAPALWIGVALLLYGAARLLGAELLPLVLQASDTSGFVVYLRPAAQVVFALLLIRAATIVPVSARISAAPLIAGSVLLLALLALFLRFVPPVASLIDGAQATGLRGYGRVNELGLLPFLLPLIAATFTWQGWRRNRWLFTWLPMLLVCIALGDSVRVTAPPPVEAGLLAKEVMRLLGLLLALNGATREILYTYRDNSTRAARSEFTAMTAHERIREGQAAAEERAHEARSALAAIEGATRTLEHYRDRLPSETQQALSTAVSGEIRRLQRLVSVEDSAGEVGPFSIAESIAPLIANERARGVVVDLRVPGDLNVIGLAAATEQVLQTLLDNARRYAPDTPVTVRAEQEDTWVVVRIEDRGPGVPPEQREAIFRRGVRGDHALEVSGSGLGLYVAAKLMREQGGELWVDDRPGGGASFAMALPAAEASHGTEVVIERLEEGGEVTDAGGFSSLRRGD